MHLSDRVVRFFLSFSLSLSLSLFLILKFFLVYLLCTKADYALRERWVCCKSPNHCHSGSPSCLGSCIATAAAAVHLDVVSGWSHTCDHRRPWCEERGWRVDRDRAKKSSQFTSRRTILNESIDDRVKGRDKADLALCMPLSLQGHVSGMEVNRQQHSMRVHTTFVSDMRLSMCEEDGGTSRLEGLKSIMRGKWGQSGCSATAVCLLQSLSSRL